MPDVSCLEHFIYTTDSLAFVQCILAFSHENINVGKLYYYLFVDKYFHILQRTLQLGSSFLNEQFLVMFLKIIYIAGYYMDISNNNVQNAKLRIQWKIAYATFIF